MMPSKQIEFYKTLLAERWEMMPGTEARTADKIKNERGIYTSSLSSDHRFIGITTFLVTGNVEAFRKHVAKSAELRLSLFLRFEAGEPIAQSYVTMLAYMSLFDALAAAQFQLAVDLAQIMGGRQEIERDQDDPFTIAMGYALKETVLDSGDIARTKLNGILGNPDPSDLPDEDAGFTYRDFRGYGAAFDALVARDEQAFNHALSMILDAHKRQAKKGIFRGTDDEYLCVWGVGLANLARHRGLTVYASGDLLPAALSRDGGVATDA
jgi:hypothetical protein